MFDIDKIMEMLDGGNDIKLQKKGIKLAKNIKCINAFILPMHPGCNKNVWENCAKILADKTDKELLPYLTDILLWIEDLNWPGAMIILERMKKFSEVQYLSLAIQEVISILDAIDGDNREIWLMYLSELLDNKKLKEELPEEILNILKPYYYNEEDFIDNFIFYSKIINGTLEDEYITKDECVQKLNKLNEKYENQEYYGELLNKVMENNDLDIALRAAKYSLIHNINIEKATKMLEKESKK